MRARRSPRGRRGMILPLVLAGLLVLLSLSASLQMTAWRALRGARGQWDAQHGTYAAEGEIVRALAAWNAEAAAASPIGTRRRTTVALGDGWQTATTITRTAPLTAVIQALARREHAGTTTNGRVYDGARIRRLVSRTVRLEPPPLPLLASITVLGAATVGAVRADGRDRPGPPDPLLDDCGPYRDTASVPAMAASPLVEDGLPTWFGIRLALDASSRQRHQAVFDAAMPVLRARARHAVLDAGGALPTAVAWQAIVIPVPAGVTLDAASSHVGLLVIDGDLVVRGTLRVRGLLLVRGAIQVTGTLDVEGALIVRDDAARGSAFGDATRVSYAPCLLARAAAAVARPQTATYGIWNSP